MNGLVSTTDVHVGQILYHWITGVGRPWIVRTVDEDTFQCENLDDGAEVTMPMRRLSEFRVVPEVQP